MGLHDVPWPGFLRSALSGYQTLGYSGPMLTQPELRAMDLTVALVHCMCSEVIGQGPTREADVREFVAHVHVIQQAILAQSAGREYPDTLRLLGRTIGDRIVSGDA